MAVIVFILIIIIFTIVLNHVKIPTPFNMNENIKIFCIGLNKTGTVSLHEAFEILGIKRVHYLTEDGEDIKEIIKNNHEKGDKLLKSIEEYNAYSDWALPATNNLFVEFDKQYPGSKFILNTRDLEGWLMSREKHVLRMPNLNKKREEDPDNPWYSINRDAWKIEYDEHHKAVNDYFKNREKDIISFEVTKGDGWEKLCSFLDVDIPSKPYPKSNTAKSLTLTGKIKNKLITVTKKMLNQS